MKQQFTEDYMSHKYWYQHGDRLPWMDANYVGNITVACAGTDYGTHLLGDAGVEALAATKKVIVTIPNGWVGVEFRFRSDGSENDDNILQCFASAGVDHYRWIGQLTATQGTLEETENTIFWADTLTAGATALWPTAVATSGMAATDHIATWSMNTHGYDKWLFLMSTKDANTTNLYVDFKQL